MIKGIAQVPAGRIEPSRAAGVADGKPVSRTETVGRIREGEASTIATIVAAGPPVDAARVAAIKARIADGSYPVEPLHIAEKMIELDLGKRSDG